MMYLKGLWTFKKADTAVDQPMMIIGSKKKLDHIYGPYMERPTQRERRVADAVRVHLRPSLRHKLHKSYANISRQHGYIASEAAYHLLGGKEAGYKPHHVNHEGKSHWYLVHNNGIDKRIIDITADQFEEPIPYYAGKGKGFLTRNPCKRSRELIANVERHVGGV